MKKPVTIALLAVLFLAGAMAASKPKLVDSVDAVISTSGNITTEEGEISWLELNSTVPQPTETQKVSYLNTTTEGKNGNIISHLIREDVGQEYSYRVVTEVSNSRQKVRSIPDSYSIPSSLHNYTQPTPKIQSDSQEIRNAALKITENASTDFEKLSALAAWTHDNVEYDIEMVGEEKDAKWVLENREGVCVEYTVLFTAMARSLGYPTRYVSGLTNSTDGWLAHAWAEVYVGKWVGFDPTWLEAGGMDATHIIFSRSLESESRGSSLSTRTKTGKVEWSRISAGEKLSHNQVNVKKSTQLDEITSSNLQIVSKEIGMGEKTLAYLEIESDEYQVIDLRLLKCAGDPEPISLQKPSKNVVITPDQKKIVPWVIQAKEDLDLPENFKAYTCPINFYSSFFNSKTIEPEIKQVPKTTLAAWPEKTVVKPDENQTVYIDTENLDPEVEVGVMTGKEIKKTDLDGEEQISFQFVPEKLGVNHVYAFTSKGGAKKVSFAVGGGNITLEDVQLPDTIKRGEKFNTSVKVANENSEQKVTLKVSAGDQQEVRKFLLEGTKTVNFTFEASKDMEEMTVEVSNGEKEVTQKVFLNVRGKPEMNIEGVEKISDNRVIVKVGRKENPVGAYLEVNDEKHDLTGKDEIIVDLEKGKNEMILGWTDSEGEQYSETAEVWGEGEEEQKASIIERFGFLFAVIGFVILLIAATITYFIVKSFLS